MSDSIELVVDESTVQSQPITANFAEVEKWLTEKLAAYKGLVVTEETVAEGKTIKANINRLSKAISDRRIAVKKRYLEPFETFEEQAKKLCAMCNEVSSNIDRQIKVFDEQKRQERIGALRTYFDERAADYKEMLSFESIMNPKWGNATYGEEKAQAEINIAIAQFETGLNVVKGIGGEFQLPLMQKYIETRDLTQVMNLKRALEEQKAEAEKRQQEEEARRQQAEAAKAAAASIIAESQETAQTAYSTDDVTPLDDIVTIRFEITATKKQLLFLSQYMKTIGVQPKRI